MPVLQNGLICWIFGSQNFLGGFVTVRPIFKEKPPVLVKEDLCAIIMPFDTAFDEIFNKNIRPPLESVGFTVKKADYIFWNEQKPKSRIWDILLYFYCF